MKLVKDFTQKNDFYARLIQLCDSKCVKITNVVKDLNMSTSLPTSWKNGIMPSIENAIKLAEYFDVSLDFLVRENAISSSPLLLKENIKQTPHIIVYFDFLGIKEKLKDDKTDISTLFNNVYSKIAKNADIMSDIDKVKIKRKFFSDNVVLCVEIDKNDKSFVLSLNVLIALVSAIQYDFLKNEKLLIRGCLSFGNLYINDLFLIGSVLNEVYNYESEIAVYPRILISKEFYKIIKQKNIMGINYIQQDFDGEYYLDFLERNNRNENCELNSIINELIEKQSAKENPSNKILQKINWLQLHNLSKITGGKNSSVSDFTDEETKELENFVNYLISKRK